VTPEPATTPGSDDDNRGSSFAIFERAFLGALARVMPDAQSAVLLCLAWQAVLQKRRQHGPFAGQPVASLSGPQLTEMTGRPIRTVRHALSRLKQAGRIRNEQCAAGKKGAYRLTLIVPGEERKASGSL
jgi:hypothetical protein